MSTQVIWQEEFHIQGQCDIWPTDPKRVLPLNKGINAGWARGLGNWHICCMAGTSWDTFTGKTEC